MNPEGISKAAHVSVQQKKKTAKRIGETPVQFSLTVRQFCFMWATMKKHVDRLRKEKELEGWKDSEIAMFLSENYPMYVLDRVVMRDKIRKYLTLASEISESTKTD